MKRLAQLTAFILGFTVATYAQTPQRVKNLNIDSKHLALDGYDPVAYFKEKKAVKGKDNITAEFEGVRYQFSSLANKDIFLSAPSGYEPQYGGWCAYAMGAKAEKVEVDPETFKIIDGKLYLFYNKFFNNTLDSWNKNEAVLKTNADKNWNKIAKH